MNEFLSPSLKIGKKVAKAVLWPLDDNCTFYGVPFASRFA
jgi:hypothetical protein